MVVVFITITTTKVTRSITVQGNKLLPQCCKVGGRCTLSYKSRKLKMGKKKKGRKEGWTERREM